MKRRGTSTRRASPTTTPVPDPTRPRTGAPREGPPQDPLPPQPGDHFLREQRHQLRVVSGPAGRRAASTSAARSYRPQGGRPHARSPPILRWSAKVACLSLRPVLRCRAHRRGRRPGDSLRPYGFVQTGRAVEGDGAQCGPHYVWRRSACVSSQASTAALRYRT